MINHPSFNFTRSGSGSGVKLLFFSIIKQLHFRKVLLWLRGNSHFDRKAEMYTQQCFPCGVPLSHQHRKTESGHLVAPEKWIPGVA